MYCPSCRGEFREGFTRCRDCETELVEVLPEEPPGEPLEVAERLEATEPLTGPIDWPEPDEEEPAAETSASFWSDPEKSLRAVELLLVLFVGYGRFLLSSAYDWWNGRPKGGAGLSLYANLSLILGSASTIALLAYVLFRRGRRLRDFGLAVRKEDLLVVPLLTVLTFVPNIVVRGLLGFPLLWGVEAHPWLSLAGIPSLGVIVLVSQLLNAACEELVVRAFMITEVLELTGQVPLAVLSSACFQALYHLYQGSSSALMAAGGFLICSIYYVRYRRIAPIILSHFLYDILIYGYWEAARH